MNKTKNERGVTLINLIIIILLVLILVVLLYLAYTNMNKEKSENNNLANNTNQEENLDSNQNQQNNLKEDNELDNNSNKLDENPSELDENDNSSDLDENNSSSESTSSPSSNNQYKIGDTVDIQRNKMLIRIDSVEPYTSDTGHEMKKAKVTFKNYNDQDLENLSPLYYMIKAVSNMGIGDVNEEIEYPLKFRLGNYEDNILDKKAPAGETITGYIYWQSSTATVLKISPITGIIDADNDEYSYGDPYYIDITE